MSGVKKNKTTLPAKPVEFIFKMQIKIFSIPIGGNIHVMKLLSMSAMLFFSIALNAQSDSVFVHDKSENYPLCEKIYGDFDGDGEQECVYLTYPAIHDSEGFVICPANPVTYINFSKKSIPTIKVDVCTGGHLQNLGDLNEDKRDEIMHVF